MRRKIEQPQAALTHPIMEGDGTVSLPEHLAILGEMLDDPETDIVMALDIENNPFYSVMNKVRNRIFMIGYTATLPKEFSMLRNTAETEGVANVK